MNILTLSDLTIEDIYQILQRAENYKNNPVLERKELKTVAHLFFEPSTRTHYSFDVAAKKLGYKTIDFVAESSSLKKGESLYDTVKTFEAFGVDVIIVRHVQEKFYEQLIDRVNVSLINAGDGSANHPSQSLLDLLTIYQEFGHFEGVKVMMVGDIKHSRVAHSNIEVMRRLGMEVYVSGPNVLVDSEDYIDFETGLKQVDVVMMLRVQFERHQERLGMGVEDYHALFGLTSKRVALMKKNAIIMHPGPFNRGVELDDEVVECDKSRIFKQVNNGVFIRMALLAMVANDE